MHACMCAIILPQDIRINITDITVEDAGIECTKCITIKFFPVLEDTWEKKNTMRIRVECVNSL
jgi:hypothetical protein